MSRRGGEEERLAETELYLGERPPTDRSLLFKPEWIPEGQLAHAGRISPDSSEYYYTLSDTIFDQFTVMVAKWGGERWLAPEAASFNSIYREHGFCFSEDGLWIYFSSTRPLELEETADIWRIWRSNRSPDGWSEPERVEVPGMEHRNYSHPSFTRAGRMYFHSYEPDFSDMALFSSDPLEGAFQRANRVILPEGANRNLLTPFVARDESYLLFTEKLESSHETYISYRKHGAWQLPVKLPDEVNTDNLGNPFVTPDGRYLFFAAGNWPSDAPPSDWVIRWVGTSGWLDR